MAKILIGVAIGIAASALALISLMFWNDRRPQLIGQVQGPSGEWYALYAEFPAGDYDPSWHVYQFSDRSSLESNTPESGFGNGALFETYEEGGDHDEDATLEVLEGRYLVFSKAGLFHSLYDIDCRKVLVNDDSPWNSAMELFGYGRALDDPEWPRFYVEWKLKHLHQPIIEAIAEKARCAA